MRVAEESQSSDFCMLEGSNEQKGKEGPNTILVKVMVETGAFRIWIPEATYEAVMEAVESTGAAEQNSTIVYMDEDGDRCVLSSKTFVDCAALAKDRFKLWVQKAEPEKKAEKWAEKCEKWAEKKSLWAAHWTAKKKFCFAAGYKAGYEAGLQKGAEVVMGEGEGKADADIEVDAEAAAAKFVEDDFSSWGDLKWKGCKDLQMKESSTPMDWKEAAAEHWEEKGKGGCWKGKGKGKGKGKAFVMQMFHESLARRAHAHAHARAHEQATGMSMAPEAEEYPYWGPHWEEKGWGGKGW
jgi:hypothetical protein